MYSLCRGREVLCATGADLAQYLDSRKLSITETMTQLLKLHVISPVVPHEGPSLTDSEFTPTDTAFYQLLSDAASPRSGDPMNTHYQWYGAARPAVEVSADLRGRILDLYDAHLSPDGRAVDYAGIATDPRFTAYVNASAELQRVDLTPLSREGVAQCEQSLITDILQYFMQVRRPESGFRQPEIVINYSPYVSNN